MATIKDIARLTGLHVGTVSRVLNNRGYIGEDARRRVYEAMDRLNYRPNELAQALSKQRSDTVGLLVPRAEHPFFARMIQAVSEQAERRGWKVLLGVTRAEPGREEELIARYRANRVAGVILCSPSVDPARLRELGVPVVAVERSAREASAGLVCDNYGGGRLAAAHLIERGCRCLLYLGGARAEEMPADRRAEGFAAVCRERRLSFRLVRSAQNEAYAFPDAGWIERALRDAPGTDGVFAGSDALGVRVLQCAARLSIPVPRALKVVGFDDGSAAELAVPPLTTVRQPVEEMAERALSLIAEAPASAPSDDQPELFVLPVRLVVREST